MKLIDDDKYSRKVERPREAPAIIPEGYSMTGEVQVQEGDMTETIQEKSKVQEI